MGNALEARFLQQLGALKDPLQWTDRARYYMGLYWRPPKSTIKGCGYRAERLARLAVRLF